MKPGTRLNAYEIVGPLGAGGMGEVYRATDTRLDRTVALKILPREMAADPDRRQRFEREARAIASLSHPHVCALHDVGSATLPGSSDAVEYLVMEYLEGETLAARIARGPLTIPEIVRVGSEIGEALEAAHRQRIVHRDLKPANVMLTRSGVKLLDFGLAKALAPATAGVSVLSTMTLGATTPGTLLGTLPYMAPEQIEGGEADARSDIFAFGSVLYEMAAGRRAFAADSAPAVASAILSAEPRPLAVSPSLDGIVRGCLQKNPDERWQSARDVSLQLKDVEARDRQAARATAAPAPALLPWIVAGITAAAAVAAAGIAWRMQAIATPASAFGTAAVKFTVPLGPADAYLALSVEHLAFAFSPDGRTLALVAGAGDGPTAIQLRSMSSETMTTVPGTEGASSVFWSPDGRSLGFFSQGQLRRVEIAGGTPVTLCEARRSIGQTGTWGDGVILFASVQGEQIMRVPASGGTPTLVLKAPTKGDRAVWPSFLPDGRHFLYMVTHGISKGAVMMASIDGGESREVLPVRWNAQYAAPGFLMYGQEGVLVARRFNPDTGMVSGDPVAVADRVSQFVATGLTNFHVSPAGAVVFHQGTNLARIVTFERSGRESAEIRPAGPYEYIRLLSRGRELFVDQNDPTTSHMDIWKIDLERGSDTKLTSEPAAALNAVLAADGSMIFSTARGGPPSLMRRSATGADEAIAEPGGMQTGSDISPDSQWIVFTQRAGLGNGDLMALSLVDKRIVPFQNSDADEGGARFSPDGRYVAFNSDLGGRRNVYVAPFPGPGSARVVSTGGGAVPRWSRDGRELFYLGADGKVYAVRMGTTPQLDIGRPQALFSRGAKYRWKDYEPTYDGKFIALEPVSSAAEQPLRVLLNWTAAIR